jgi:hypothetical protein
MAANDEAFTECAKVLTAKDRMEALLMACMNEEKAALCSSVDQPGLKAMFQKNAELFRRLAS